MIFSAAVRRSRRPPRLLHGFGLVLPLLLLAAPAAHAVKRAAEWIDFARHEAHAGRHESALAAVDSALVQDPKDFGGRLLKARLLSWRGRFDEAGALLGELADERPHDEEVKLATSSLRYYQGRHAEAAAGFRAMLAASPGHVDARQGLALAERALAGESDGPRVPPQWRVDAGGDYSVFRRRTLPDWNQQFVQLARRLPLSGAGVASPIAHAKVERYERYDLVDWSLEAGIHHVFAPRMRGSLAAGWTPAADFRPDWRMAATAEGLAVAHGETAPRARPAVWLLADARYDVYGEDAFLGLQPGARLEWGGGPWALTGKVSQVVELGAGSTTGWSLRGDGVTGSPRLGPLRENARFWLGAADAPETQVVDGVTETVSTRTVFAGVGIDLAGDWGVMFGYARDDREGSWIRHAFHAGVARAF